MQLITNSVDSSTIHEVTENGTRYFIAEDVPFIRSRRLAGGYVPEDHVEQSVGSWDGAPLTLNHPRNENGEVVSANTTNGEAVTVGSAYNPQPTDDDAEVGVKGDLRINADRAEALGEDGQALVNALESGAGIEVSSQYFADNLPAGVYDGKQRARVEGNLRPDSIALLPTKEGVCSLPDCGIAPDAGAGTTAATANADRHLSLTAVPQSDETWTANGEPSPGLIRRGLAALGMQFDESGDSSAATANQVGDGDGCGCGCGGACDDAEAAHSGDDEPADTGSGESGDGNESPTDNETTDKHMVDISRDTIIESTADKTGLNADALGELDDDALTTLYERGADEGAQAQVGDADADPAADADEATANSIDTDALVDEVVERVTEEISANSEQSEKADLADEIVANSAEYDADDRDELLSAPKSVLEGLRNNIDNSGSAGLPGTTGTVSANAAIGGDGDDVDIEEFGSGVISDD